jgi:heterodisulfide reductase subunit A
LDNPNVAVVLETLIDKVEEHPLIEVFLNASIESIDGYIGNFSTKIEVGEEEQALEHGTVIVATGAEEHQTESYGYKGDPFVVTQREFENMLQRGHRILDRIDSVAMIQCVDSREEDRNYCSRVCCGQAVKNALRFKSDYPQKDVYVLYRDMRTYGLMEERYTEARKSGTLFIRYPEDSKPMVQKDEGGGFVVKVFDDLIQREIEIPVQLVVLGVGVDALETNEALAKMLKVPLNEDGFFLEAHVKLRPVDFATDGVFVCGMAHGPKYAGESVAQALAAAGRALTVMTRDRITAEASTAMVREERCTGCGLCVEVCSYGAIELDQEKEIASVNALLCKGCGSCAATCFSGAIDLKGFSNKQIIKEFEELLV